jgi:2-oxoisovalerate dehydrogenase E1 component alpha subunit
MVRRFNPHSSDDDDRTYRPAHELELLRQDGPIRTTGKRLRDLGIIDDAWEQSARERVRTLVNEATAAAEEAPLPEPETFAKHVYFEG